MRCNTLTTLVVIGLMAVVNFYLQAQEETTPAPIEETYQLVPVIKPGDKIEVKQALKWDGTVSIKTGEESYQYPFLKSLQNQYSEEILSSGTTISSVRTYTLSRLKTNLPAEKAEESSRDSATSLEGKKVALETTGQTVSSVKPLNTNKMILSDDAAYITPLTEYHKILPATAVKVGEEWKINSAELAQAIFREDYDEKLCSLEGQATLSEVSKEGEAKISLQIKATRKETANTPALAVELKGESRFAGDKNLLTSITLSGKFTITKTIKLTEESQIDIQAKGTVSLSSETTPR